MILKLKYYGDSVLRKICAPIKEITDEIRQFCQDLIETVLDHDGAGLAAPQVGKPIRIFVSRYASGADAEGWPILRPPKIYINPKLLEPSEEIVIKEEGCLSVPGIYVDVPRPNAVTIEATDLEGNIFKERLTSWGARAVMHENDHLNGVLHIDRSDSKNKEKVKKELRELKKKYNHPH